MQFITYQIKNLAVFVFALALRLCTMFFVKNNENVLCFDCLYDKFQEQNDVYTFFKYIHKQGVPAKYFVLEDFKDKFKDDKNVYFVKNKWDFIFRYFFEILKSKIIITSFGLFDGIDEVLSKYINSKYIFLEHGVIYLPKTLEKIYSPDKFNKILVPTKFTLQAYRNNKIWKEENMILSGLPRWDNLSLSNSDNKKNIFVFFSWRKVFLKKPNSAKQYIKAIVSFLDKLSSSLPLDVEISFAWHHEILKNNIMLPELNFRINLVKTDEISDIIQKSSLLITDYSSVCWDYFYLDKPVVFYRFDSEAQYLSDDDIIKFQELKYIDDIFPNCFYGENETLKKVIFYIENNFALEKVYKDFISSMFWEKDKNSHKIHSEIFNSKEVVIV